MRLKYLVSWFFATFFIAASAAPMRACIDYASKIPSISPGMCHAAGLRDMQGRSSKGRTLWGTDVQPNTPNFRVLVIGGIHGDEMTSSALVFHWITLAQTPPSDMALSIHWRFIPSLNPDGLFSKPSRRTNANGVDLNRNFPTPNWERDAKEYWEIRTRRDPRRWPGPKPLSEPESRFMLEQMDTFKPNLIVSVHAPYGVLDFDGPSVPPSKLGRLYLDQVGIFPGSLGNYGGIHKRVPVVTIELPNAARMIQDAETRQMWIDLLRWTTERLGPAQVAESH
jgi:murein peptide amidase A